MKPQEKYEGKIWVKIRRLPYLVAMCMEGAAKSGIGGSARERQAMMESLIEGGKTYPENEIIQAIVPKADNHMSILEKAAEQHDELLNCLDYHDIQDNKGLQKHILNVLVIVLGVLNSREQPETVADYKEWLLEIAKSVAYAAKEGDFLGLGGQRFSPAEKEFYAALEAKLK
ncbi:MAG: hypothetical protein P8Z38_00145 [Robiginitalea sp.]